MASEYETKANAFLESHAIRFHAKQMADKCPIWCDGQHIHGDRYLVTFSRKPRKRMTLSFWNSLDDVQHGRAPTAYDVLAAIEKYDPGTFEDFCGEFGYDTDSRKAATTYRLVIREWRKVSGFFTSEELTEAQEIQ